MTEDAATFPPAPPPPQVGDTPVDYETISRMTDADYAVLLTAIRERRLKTVQIYEKAKAEKDAIRDEQLKSRLAHEMRMFEKEHAALMRDIDKVESRVTKINSIRLEIGTYDGRP